MLAGGSRHASPVLPRYGVHVSGHDAGLMELLEVDGEVGAHDREEDGYDTWVNVVSDTRNLIILIFLSQTCSRFILVQDCKVQDPNDRDFDFKV